MIGEGQRLGAESAAYSPAVIDRGRPVHFSTLERFPANMDDLGKFARRERNIYTSRGSVTLLFAETRNAGVSCIFHQTGSFKGDC